MLENGKIIIDEFTSFTEKGNTLLCGEDGCMVVWLKAGTTHSTLLPGSKKQDVYIEISYVPLNSPRLNVCGVWTSAKKLRAHARKMCKGWCCVRWNIDEKPPINKNGDIK